MVHSEEDYNMAVEASNILFGKATKESLTKLDEQTLLDVFAGVPQFEVSREALSAGIKAVDLTAEMTQCFPSKGADAQDGTRWWRFAEQRKTDGL